VSAGAVVLARPRLAQTVAAYVSLTKPRIISLLLITTAPAMVVAAEGMPSPWLVLATLLGGAISAAGANVINCWYDRDIDAIMKRTAQRPTVTGEIQPWQALTFGISLGAGAFVFLWAATTFAAAVLALTALLFYVFVYTVWLKRRTPQNIVIGGAAGAFPPMVGWAAVTGHLSFAPLIMFAIIFFWTPPHFWALSLKLEKDYEAAHIPMLPVAVGPEITRLEILRYSVMLVLISLLLAPAAGLGAIYLGSAAVMGALFIRSAVALWRRPREVSPMGLYKYSLLYLGLLFIAMGVDAALLG
jgi:protoheme IX farnesyltransferase